MRITKLLVSLMILLASEAHAFEPNGLVVFLSDLRRWTTEPSPH